MMPEEAVRIAHGGGGQLMHELIRQRIAPKLANPILEKMTDAADLGSLTGRIAFTSDGYVVQPIFFPGGDIGRLAVCGTVNDLAMMGARPVALALSLILEEGFPLGDLERVVAGVSQAAEEAQVPVVTGDTKVVERGKGDGIYVTTAGIGRIIEGFQLDARTARPGDALIVSGTLGEHGLTILSLREGLAFASNLKSDANPLNSLVEDLTPLAPAIRFMRDATRGGCAAAIVELASEAGLGVELDEEKLPIRPSTQAAADLFGLDVLSVANEGKMILVVAADAAEEALARLRGHPLGRDAALVGELREDPLHLVELKTRIGGRRILQMPYGEELPRIC